MSRKDKIKSRLGEEGYNNFGSKMVISEYRGSNDLDVYFPEYNWTAKGLSYQKFKRKEIKCPYERRTCNKGYIGEGIYFTSGNDEHIIMYEVWNKMIQRAYSKNVHKMRPSYDGCEVEEFLLNFQNFGDWWTNNYYEVPGEKMHLDKDILCKGNKIYSRETCIFVPSRINELFTKSDRTRGKYPIGVTRCGNKYSARITKTKDGEKHRITLGYYSTPEEAFYAYKYAKENYIKEVIDSYEGIIPEPYYSRLKTAMYKYKVEITD